MTKNGSSSPCRWHDCAYMSRMSRRDPLQCSCFATGTVSQSISHSAKVCPFPNFESFGSPPEYAIGPSARAQPHVRIARSAARTERAYAQRVLVGSLLPIAVSRPRVHAPIDEALLPPALRVLGGK